MNNNKKLIKNKTLNSGVTAKIRLSETECKKKERNNILKWGWGCFLRVV